MTRVRPIQDEAGKLTRWVGVNTNIQAQLDQAHELESMRAKLDIISTSETIALMVAAVNDYAIFMLDRNGYVQSWNSGAQRIKGYSEDEILGKHFSIFYPDAIRETGHPEQELEIASREGRYEEEGWRVRKDGSLFWANVVITAVNDGQGKLIGFGKVTRDLTERKEAQRQLETYSLLIESVKDYAIFMLDCDGTVRTWNKGAERIKGYTSQEIIGKHFSIFYSQDSRDAKHPEMELEMAKKEGRYEEEGWRYRKDGSPFWASVVITAVHDKIGELIGFAKVTRDLTERREADLALRQSRDEAIAASEAQSRFLSTVSHEVRTPMAGVIGLVELINSSSTDDQIKVFSQAALDSSKRLLQILNSLLDAARLKANSVVLENRYFAVRPVIGDLVQLVAAKVNKKQLSIEAHVSPEVPELVCGDELRVRQILQNLVFNAVKFTEQGGVSISVDLLRRDEICTMLKFTVADTGIGISDEQKEKIFEPFVQADDSIARVYGGTGLGLNIARTLTELMKGEIGVTSQPGEGSAFWVTIPFGEDLCKTT